MPNPVKNKGQFQKGQSGNPAGRPLGSRNRATELMELLLEGQAEKLTRKAVEMAKAGDATALRLCLTRLLPPRRERCIHLALGPVRDLSDIPKRMNAVLQAVSDGQITPGEGEILVNLLTAQAKMHTVIEQRTAATSNRLRTLADLERELAEAEAGLSAGSSEGRRDSAA
jgi:hypothetical protein